MPWFSRGSTTMHTQWRWKCVGNKTHAHWSSYHGCFSGTMAGFVEDTGASVSETPPPT